MLIFRLWKEKVELQKTWLPKIYEEIKTFNETVINQTRTQRATSNDLVKEIRELAQMNREFVETIRGFFAFEKTRQTEQAKKTKAEEEEFLPTKHDFVF